MEVCVCVRALWHQAMVVNDHHVIQPMLFISCLLRLARGKCYFAREQMGGGSLATESLLQGIV